ncbi:hypothetical protein [Methylobacterium sp. JK268]
MTALLHHVFRRGSAALLGLALLLLGASAALAGPVPGGSMMRAVTPEMIDASLHADLPGSATPGIADLTEPGEPSRPSDDGAQGACPVEAPAPRARASSALNPPRHLGAAPTVRSARFHRPPRNPA